MENEFSLKLLRRYRKWAAAIRRLCRLVVNKSGVSAEVQRQFVEALNERAIEEFSRIKAGNEAAESLWLRTYLASLQRQLSRRHELHRLNAPSHRIFSGAG